MTTESNKITLVSNDGAEVVVGKAPHTNYIKIA
jgi:hypothetical protein